MSETAQDKVNRILRDHEGYTGDGKGGDGALPVGDRSTAVKPIVKRDLREAMTETLVDSYEARDIAVDAAQRAEAAALGVEYPVSYAPGQGLNPTQQGDARDNLGLGTAATVDHGTDPGEVPLNSDLGTMATEDAGDYVTKVSKATQVQAEGGVTGDVWMDDIRVRQAIAMHAIGVEQVWVSVTRTSNTWYQNTTGRPLQVSISGYNSSGTDARISQTPSGGEIIASFGGTFNTANFIVPPGYYYLRGSMTQHSAMELR